MRSLLASLQRTDQTCSYFTRITDDEEPATLAVVTIDSTDIPLTNP